MDAQKQQLEPYPDQADKIQYNIACTGLAEKLLKPEHSLKNCRGEVLMEHLTSEQARMILDRKEKILIVRGKSGTGKTAVALSLIQEAKALGTAANILYICASAGVKAWVESQQLCKVRHIHRTDCLYGDDTSLMEHCDLVVVDDAHAIVLSEHWEDGKVDNDLYKLLFTCSAKTSTEVVIFFDPNQDFRCRMSDDFDEKLLKLAVNMAKRKKLDMTRQQFQIVELKERIRNSREINSFIQANLNHGDISEEVACLNERDGDDITYSYVGTSMDEIASRMNAILLDLTQQYDKKSIVILCDDNEQLGNIQQNLTTEFRWQIQNATSFPIKQTVVCKLEDFGGLEADVILFLLPPNWGSEYVGNCRYVHCVSSRAIQRLQFLLPWDPSENEQENRQEKLEQFLELFRTVSTNTLPCSNIPSACIQLRNCRY